MADPDGKESFEEAALAEKHQHQRQRQLQVHQAGEEEGRGGRIHTAEALEVLLHAGNTCIVNMAPDDWEGTAVGPSSSRLPLHSSLEATYPPSYPSSFHPFWLLASLPLHYSKLQQPC